MGFIKAFSGAIGGTFADQWLDYLMPRGDISSTSVVFGAVSQGTNAGRGANTKGSNNIISNGSNVIVPEGTALITMQEGGITGIITEPGGYKFSSDDINAKSIFAGDGIISSLIKQSWERFKYGGQPASQHMMFYVNMKEIPGNKFGTQSTIYWDDAYLGAQVGAITRGTYSLRVEDPITFLKQFVPTQYLSDGAPIFDLADLENEAAVQLFEEVVSSLSQAFSRYTNDPDKGNRISKIQSDQVGFAQSLSQAVEENYSWKSGRGLVIDRVAIAAIEYDEDTVALLSDVKKADALSGARGNSFMQQSVARGMQAAGENSANGGAGMAFMGMGMNAAGGIVGNMQQTPQSTPAAENIQQQAQASEEDPYEKLAKMKKLLDDDIITQEEFDSFKAKVLDL